MTSAGAGRRDPVIPQDFLGIDRGSSDGEEGSLLLSVIVPFHRNLRQLERCLAALRAPAGAIELIVAADGAVDDCRALAASHGARVVEIPGPSGPAVARNRAAATAAGDVLVFVDADVVIAEGALDKLRATLEGRPDVAAVFGAYDEDPFERNFISQYKNLAHSYIHQSSFQVAETFWAGFGAVRTRVFLEIGGFDERFSRPSIEDIELGYRLTAAGHVVLLDHTLRACHLKRWTLRSMVASDVFDRGIPWTQLILKFGRFNNDLNLRSSYRACVVLAYVMVFLLVLSIVDARALIPIPAGVAMLVALSRRYYTYFLRQRGLWFTIRLFPFHVLYHLYNGFSFAVGTSLYLASRSWGVQLPGALPVTVWPAGQALAPSIGRVPALTPGAAPERYLSREAGT